MEQHTRVAHEHVLWRSSMAKIEETDAPKTARLTLERDAALNYLTALYSLARVDGIVNERELEFIQAAALLLKVQVEPEDLFFKDTTPEEFASALLGAEGSPY